MLCVHELSDPSTMEFKHYSEAPKNVSEAIITARGK
jgi:hypothetical protein